MLAKRVKVKYREIMMAMLGSGMVGIALAQDPAGYTIGIGRTKEDACAMATTNAERAASKSGSGKQEWQFGECVCNWHQGGEGLQCRVKWILDAPEKAERRGANR